MACPADLETSSAAFRYILREHGKERVFSLRPSLDEVLTIPNEITGNSTQSIHLLINRANQRAPLLTDGYLRCLARLIRCLLDKGSTVIHFPILDPERPALSLVNLYHTMMNLFADTEVRVVLHNRVYVSILSVGLQ